jgi:sugar/nucleoside kinase (ribokinase family)
VAPTFVTVAGPEPEASAGLSRLRQVGRLVVQPAAATTTYRHREDDGRRVLEFETATEPLRGDSFDGLAAPEVALVAPIAHEVPAPLVGELVRRVRPRLTMLLVQGWLRRLAEGEATHPVPLDELDDGTWAAFGATDAVVLSTEDLAESAEDPFVQAADMRARLGPRPLLVLTLGTEGYLLDDPRADRVVATVPRRVVTGVPAVGAGDTFGAVLAVQLGRGASPVAAAQAASDGVIRMLESRR